LPTTPIYIGFDGGGSTSRFLVKRGALAPKTFSYPLNLKYTDLNIADSAKNFSVSVKEILGSEQSDLVSMCISLSGASNEVSNLEFAAALKKEMHLPKVNIHIESDSSFSLQTAYPGDESGMLLITGTGSVAIAKKRNGELVKIGGWGRLLGDEGSGYWIGLEALKYYTKVVEGSEDTGKLFGRIKEKFTGDFSQIRRQLYSGEMKPQDFAPIVFDSLRDDCYAKDILYNASRHLSEGVEILWDLVKDECQPILTLHGKVALNEFMVRNISEDLECLGIECKIMGEQPVLKRALQVAQHL
jgi:N-acetylglucosamine kinase-like BadF-type ATPase